MRIEELLALERDGWDALCQGRGAEFYGRLMTEDALMVLAHGFVLDRDAVVASLDDAEPWREYEITEPRVVGVGDCVAALVYTAQASRSADESPFRALMSSVYARRDGEWRLTLYQQTPLPDR